MITVVPPLTVDMILTFRQTLAVGERNAFQLFLDFVSNEIGSCVTVTNQGNIFKIKSSAETNKRIADRLDHECWAHEGYFIEQLLEVVQKDKMFSLDPDTFVAKMDAVKKKLIHVNQAGAH